MMATLKSISLSITFIILFIGCTPVALNTGSIDYVRADRSQVTGEDTTLYESLRRKYDESNDDNSLIIQKGESVSVTLQHVFIKDYSERLERFTSKFSGDAVRGEIAILAKVYEQVDGTSIDHTQGGIKKSGRLIYYSEDVRSGGHPLNFSQLPVYGPIEYKGNSLVVQFTILELDIEESDQLKGILGTLSQLGQKSYPPSSPVLKVLDSVGSNLLSGAQDDLEFSYSFTLHPDTGHQQVKDAKLMVGDYILLKEEPSILIGEPFAETKWDQFEFDSDEGRLKRKTGDSWINFTDNTYIVLQLNTGLPSVGLDVAQAFSVLESELSGTIDNTDLNSRLGEAIDVFKLYTEEQQEKEFVKKLYSRSMSLLNNYSTNTDEDTKKQDLAGFYDFVVTKFGFPTARPAPALAPDFTENQWIKIIQKLRSIAKDPFKINKKSVTTATDYSALEILLN